VKRRQDTIAEELKKIRLGVDDVDRLDMLIPHFVLLIITTMKMKKKEKKFRTKILLE
jgi:hypothetical protein